MSVSYGWIRFPFLSLSVWATIAVIPWSFPMDLTFKQYKTEISNLGQGSATYSPETRSGPQRDWIQAWKEGLPWLGVAWRSGSMQLYWAPHPLHSPPTCSLVPMLTLAADWVPAAKINIGVLNSLGGEYLWKGYMLQALAQKVANLWSIYLNCWCSFNPITHKNKRGRICSWWWSPQTSSLFRRFYLRLTNILSYFGVKFLYTWLTRWLRILNMADGYKCAPWQLELLKFDSYVFLLYNWCMPRTGSSIYFYNKPSVSTAVFEVGFNSVCSDPKLL